jgi:hypothetical protein
MERLKTIAHAEIMLMNKYLGLLTLEDYQNFKLENIEEVEETESIYFFADSALSVKVNKLSH